MVDILIEANTVLVAEQTNLTELLKLNKHLQLVQKQFHLVIKKSFG